MTFRSKNKVAFYVALCMLCAMAEMVIPKPSFIKIGFSNIPIMLALANGFTVKEYILLVVLRLVCQALLNGTVFSYASVLSVSAGAVSATAMYFAHKIPSLGFVGLSEIGAFCSNIVQLYVSSIFMGSGVFYLAPAILGVGIVTSFILGLFTPAVAEKLDIANRFSELEESCELNPEKSLGMVSFSGLLKPVFSMAILFVCFFTTSLSMKACICVLFVIACVVSKKRIRLILSAFVLFETVILALLVPYGKVLFNIWFWPITEGALELGLKRAFVLLSSFYFSRFIVPDKEKIETAKGTLVYLILFYFRKLSEPEGVKHN